MQTAERDVQFIQLYLEENGTGDQNWTTGQLFFKRRYDLMIIYYQICFPQKEFVLVSN